MGMIYGRIKSDQTTVEEDIKYWKENPTPAKDLWNQRLPVFYSKLQVLFDKKIANKLMIAKNNTFKDYNKNQPKKNHTTLQGSFEDAHQNLYYLLWTCNKDHKCKDWTVRTEELKIQLDEINEVNNLLSDEIVNRLLDTPYGLSVDE